MRLYCFKRRFQVVIAGADSFYVLKYNKSVVENADPNEIPPDGLEDAFDVLGIPFFSYLVLALGFQNSVFSFVRRILWPDVHI